MDNNKYVAPDYEVLNNFRIPYVTFKHMVDTLKARYTETDGYSDPIKFAVLNDLEGLLYREMAAVATERAKAAEERANDFFGKLMLDTLGEYFQDDEDEEDDDYGTDQGAQSGSDNG